MIVWEPFDPWLQIDESSFVPIEMPCEIGAGFPDTVRVRADRYEDIEQVLDIYVLRRDPSCFPEVGLVWINIRVK